MHPTLRRLVAPLVAGATLTAGFVGVTLHQPAGAAVVALPTPPAATPARTGIPREIAVLGDSISQGTGSDGTGAPSGGIGSPRVEASWATGNHAGLNSNYQRIRALPGGSALTTRSNLSANGANMRNNILAQAQSVPSGTDYVMVEMGGNDLCRPTESAMTSELDYRAQFRAALQWLRTNRPETLIFTASVPDIYNLWYVRGAAHVNESYNLGFSRAAGPRAARDSTEDSNKGWARFFWDGFLGSVIPCESLLVDPANPKNAGPTPDANNASEARRLRVRARAMAFNTILQQECAAILRCRFDDRALFNFTSNRDANGNLQANKSLWNFRDIHISTQDHFHPSFAGQQKVAENTFQASYDFTDATAPTVALGASPAATTSGWNRSNVTVTASASDASGVRGVEYRVHNGSGTTAWTQVLGSSANVTVTTAGASHVEARALDANGNQSASRFHTVGIDRTAPQVSLATPVQGARYDHHADVAADYSCSDAAGGADIASCEGTVADGASIDTSTVGTKQFSVTATDGAGNTTTVTRSYTVVDVTPPTIDLRSPGAGSSFDRRAVIEADYDCADEPGGSGLARCAGTVADGDAIDTATIGAKEFTVDAADVAGNQERVTHSYTVRDVTKPTITLTTPASGAVYDRHQVVPAAYSCEDDEGGSGVAPGYCVGTVAAGSPLGTSSLGSHSFSVTATDREGNTETVTRSYTVRDVTAPTVGSSQSGNEHRLGERVSAQFSCTDEAGGSGVASCSGPELLDTSSVGTKTFSVTTTDAAGNSRTVPIAYRVVYAYGEVRQPINPDGSSTFKAGSTVPVKFGLTDAAGRPVGTASPTISYTSFDPEAVVGEEATEPVFAAPATGGTQLRWDATSEQYVFNLGTKSMKAGTYKLVISLDDGKRYSAVITLR